MRGGVQFDGSELAAFARDLERVAAVASREAAKVVAKAALNIKNDARQRISGLSHAPAYPASITYDDVRPGPRWVQTYVGPDKSKRQGSLGNILEFGTIHNPPHPHLAPAAEAEEPRFVKAMEDYVVKALQR